MTYPAPPRLVVLGEWLVASFAWGRFLCPALMFGAIIAGILGLNVVAYLLLGVLVLAVAWVCVGCGVWLWLLAFVVCKVQRSEGKVIAAYLRFGLWAAAGTFLIWCGIGALLGFFLHWPLGYWPQATVP